MAERGGHTYLTAQMSVFMVFLWSSPSTCLPIGLRPGGRGGPQTNWKASAIFGCTAAVGLAGYSRTRSFCWHGPLLKTFVSREEDYYYKCLFVISEWSKIVLALVSCLDHWTKKDRVLLWTFCNIVYHFFWKCFGQKGEKSVEIFFEKRKHREYWSTLD